MRSRSSLVLMQEPAEQVASVDQGRLIVADEGRSGCWVRRFQAKRSAWPGCSPCSPSTAPPAQSTPPRSRATHRRIPRACHNDARPTATTPRLDHDDASMVAHRPSLALSHVTGGVARRGKKVRTLLSCRLRRQGRSCCSAQVRYPEVDPTDHNPNTPAFATPLVEGPMIRLPGHHAKVRRAGYSGHRRGGPGQATTATPAGAP